MCFLENNSVLLVKGVSYNFLEWNGLCIFLRHTKFQTKV